MNNIPELLEYILTSRYGRDVRQAIHDCIEAMYNYLLGFLDDVGALVTQATQAKNDAVDAKNAASGFATDAQGYASDSQGYASDSQGYASDAQGYASDASGYANDASGYADNASGFADDAAASATQAETAVSNLGNLSGLMQIDSEGHLIVGDLTGFGGTFSIVRSTGHLWVEWT